jgi:hypothetical protein
MPLPLGAVSCPFPHPIPHLIPCVEDVPQAAEETPLPWMGTDEPCPEALLVLGLDMGRIREKEWESKGNISSTYRIT